LGAGDRAGDRDGDFPERRVFGFSLRYWFGAVRLAMLALCGSRSGRSGWWAEAMMSDWKAPEIIGELRKLPYGVKVG
tara:strand:- start:4734 stop:4964 length:231 start_codon:yes stop_codon:yes gene_type:complete